MGRARGVTLRGSNGIPDQLTERHTEVNADMKRDDGITKPSERGMRVHMIQMVNFV